MSKSKVIVTFSIPVKVKEMLEALAKITYSTNTKVIVDLIRKDYDYWFERKGEQMKDDIKIMKNDYNKTNKEENDNG